MLTPRVTETHRLSPYAFMYEGAPTIPVGETVRLLRPIDRITVDLAHSGEIAPRGIELPAGPHQSRRPWAA